MNKISLSILIVHYKNEKDLLECLDSFYKYKPKIPFEIIIVDNSENRNVKKKLSKYRQVKYVSSSRNLGYGAGMNLGASSAKGKYLFVLNPDVIFTEDIASSLFKKMEGSGKAGIIAPLLLTTDNKIMDQGAQELTPLRSAIKFSFLDKIWSNNPISKKFWVKNWNDTKLKEVDNVPGTAFLIKKDLFDKLKGFDENFFLYFEEFDLCKRARTLGYKIYVDPASKLIHKWGTSTKLLNNNDKIFKQSRFYYFKKHFGVLKAWLIESFLLLTPSNIIFLIILSLGLFIRLYNLSFSVSGLIGDQGWFYLSARDMLTNGTIPLVGITSSHVWLHQGPLWTYILSLIFYLTHFNPLAPAVFTVFLDSLTLSLIYFIVKRIFNVKTALFASLIYAFSPYIILASRMPYHTSMIPLLMLLFFFSLYKWIKGSPIFFSLSILLTSLLYNFELQTALLYILIAIFLIYGYVRKAKWFRVISNRKIVIISLIFFIFPLLPVLIYDTTHGFVQTIVFAGWIVYKAVSPVFDRAHINSADSYADLGKYFYKFFNNLIFIKSEVFSLIIFAASILVLAYKVIFAIVKKNVDAPYTLLFYMSAFILIGIAVGKTASDAYLYSLLVPLVIVLSVFLASISKNKFVFVCFFTVMAVISFFNSYYLVRDRFINNVMAGYMDQVQASKFMAKDSKGQGFKIVGFGPGSQFESFTASYKYLSWYYGGKPDARGKIVYTLYETPKGIKIIRKN